MWWEAGEKRHNTENIDQITVGLKERGHLLKKGENESDGGREGEKEEQRRKSTGQGEREGRRWTHEGYREGKWGKEKTF